MTILSDAQILKRCRDEGMIQPFIEEAVRTLGGKKVISYGVSAYGYDIRLADDFKLFNYKSIFNGVVIDPKMPTDALFTEIKAKQIDIPANSMVLCRSLEYFRIPKDILGVCVGKSTYARCGVIANITPLEAEWEGVLTIELSNTTPLPVRIYAGEGIAQVLFYKGSKVCNTSYRDKGGKYMGQTGVTGSRL